MILPSVLQAFRLRKFCFKAEDEGAADSILRLHQDFTTGVLANLLANVEAQPDAVWVSLPTPLRVHLVKGTENAVLLFEGNPDTSVVDDYFYPGLVALADEADLDGYLLVFVGELEGVGE